MQHRAFSAGALLAAAAALTISACGSSTPSPSGTSTASAAGTSTASASAPLGGAGADSGSAFCQQAAQLATQLKGLSTGLAGSAGATPSVTNYQQIFAVATRAIDSLDASAPNEIASAFHQLRAAYDQLNTQVQAATSVEQMTSAFSALSTASITSASTTVTTYFEKTCGISASASP